MIELYQGDCQEVMKGMQENSVSSIVTDPPYGLSFMGKKWDYDVPSVEIWQEALRVLKPGGHALIFAGSRTQHRMAINIEDAGFFLKDCIMWLYGSGFPKSTDISKQIDKYGGAGHLVNEISEQLKKARTDRNISSKEADRIFCNSTTNYSWFEGRPQGNRIPNQETFKKIVSEWPELETLRLAVEEAEREVIGEDKSGKNAMLGGLQGVENGGEFDITAPATPAAQLWEGYGTALKPAYEPIIVAMKPNDGTYANNALKHGVAGINIDGCRVALNGDKPSGSGKGSKNSILSQVANSSGNGGNKTPDQGRFPANIIHDGSEEVLNLFPTSSTTGNRSKKSKSSVVENTNWLTDNHESTEYIDSGSAARFFYTAKATKAERNQGIASHIEKDGNWEKTKGNDHPTVKPLTLMEYLCKLVKPPENGMILDMFLGSSTTGIACHNLKIDFIGIERDPEYFKLAKQRIDKIESQLSF